MVATRAAIVLAQILSFFPLWFLHRLSDSLALLLQWVFAYRQKVVQDNIYRAFPQCHRAFYRKVIQGFYLNFSDLLVESIKSLHISPGEMKKRLRLRNPEVLEQLYRQKRGVIMVMGHYANFEWLAMGIPLLVPQPCYAVYQKLKNREFSKMVVKIREQFGLTLFPMADTYPFMLHNEAEAPLYVFMADQSPHKGKIKFRTSFLGRSTPVHLGVENLARQCDLAVVFMEMHRMRRGRYELVCKLLYENTQKAKPYEVTRRHVAALEERIRQKPQDWLWSHKRWKHAQD